jgi:hypothetical protein
MRHLRSVVCAVAISATAAVLPVGAAGAAAVHDPSSGSVHNLDETFVDVVPCIGDFELHTVANATQHGVSNKNGDWETFTETGTFETGDRAINVVRNDNGDVLSWGLVPANVQYSGHFTIWGNFNGNPREWNSTFTFSGHGTGSDGTSFRWNNLEHINVTGEITRSAFDRSSCR